MREIESLLNKIKDWIGKEGKCAFFSVMFIGLFTHMPILVRDIPNHDGLASLYFDQNMVTSGRWFLMIACGISSFYSVPWLIGILAIIYVGIANIIICKTLKVDNKIAICLIGGLLITFPSIASNFAYVFTMDGYMIGLLLAVLSVYLVDKNRLGFLFGGIALAFSMGTYQAYLPIAMLLCIYVIATEWCGIKKALRYLYMGLIGVSLYYVVLQVLLKLQGKELDTYQGINGMAETDGLSLIATVKAMYVDFVSFLLKGNVFFNNVFALIACIALLVAFLAAVLYTAIKKGYIKKWWFYVAGLVIIALLPIVTNAILLISKDVTYHLLMRYQYGFLLILMLAFIDKVLNENDGIRTLAWLTVLSSFALVFCFAISTNIGYSNLEKKYEKTYAYCLRLADRIEQTEGYYEGIPIYMIGVVGTDNFPKTDITENVTDHMIGLSGDWLLYRPENYELFYKNYMGITFNFLRPDEANYYDSKEYIELDSFPGKNATKVVNGVLYVKTENMH